MKDFKQNTKMNANGSHYCGGGKVKNYAEGGEVKNTLDETQAESRRMQREGIPSKPTREQMPAVRMTRIANQFGGKSSAPAETAKKRSDKGADAEELQKILGSDVKVGYKRGGKVKRGCK
jgi:hypothetical protein